MFSSKKDVTKTPAGMETFEKEEEYKLKMSENSNYLKFLQLTHGSHSDDEGSHGDLEGYVEDDMMGEVQLSECEADVDPSDLTEADEHLYDNSPTFETDEKPRTEEAPMSEEEKQRQIEEYKEELIRVEGEIATLRQVLGSKVRYAGELKRKIGITPLQELKQDFQSGIKSIQQSDTYQKTNEKLHDINDKITHSTAYQKTSAAMKTASEKTNETVRNVASSVTKKLGDIRNSNTFKSVEERVGGAYANVKAKVVGSKSEENFESALAKDSQANSENSANGTQSVSLPEEKVPL